MYQFKYHAKKKKPTVKAENFKIFPLKELSDLSSSNLYSEYNDNIIANINKKYIIILKSDILINWYKLYSLTTSRSNIHFI